MTQRDKNSRNPSRSSRPVILKCETADDLYTFDNTGEGLAINVTNGSVNVAEGGIDVVKGDVQLTSGNLNVEEGKIQENGNDLLPSGTIVMWNGVDVPAGWIICDGNSGTPDLIDRFIMAADPSNTNQKNSGDAKISLPPLEFKTDESGAHAHTIGVDTHGGKDVGVNSKGVVISHRHTEEGGKHSHSGLTSAIEIEPDVILPKWYALCFIMKL